MVLGMTRIIGRDFVIGIVDFVIAGFATTIIFAPLALGLPAVLPAADFGRAFRELVFGLRADVADILFFAGARCFLDETRAEALRLERLFAAIPDPSGYQENAGLYIGSAGGEVGSDPQNSGWIGDVSVSAAGLTAQQVPMAASQSGDARPQPLCGGLLAH
jgi:hypothetical protein